MRRIGLIALLLLATTSATPAQDEKLPKWVTDSGGPSLPGEGVVRDPESAIRIARAVWLSYVPAEHRNIVGTESDWLNGEQATLTDGVWEVCEKPHPHIGGGVFIYITKKDARVMGIEITQ
ncbi:MAG TPA: hypothetical protein VJ476_14120 [Rhizomicrobium sp.]|nr:hypothetical protein [Rhizomicrobium sp.]